MEVRWQRKAELVEWNKDSAVSPSKCYILKDKVYSDRGQSASQRESVCYIAAHNVWLTSLSWGSTLMLTFR